MSDPSPPTPPHVAPEPASPAPQPAPAPTGKPRGACFTAFVIILVVLGLGAITTFFAPPIVADFLHYRVSKFAKDVRENTFTQDIQETFREEALLIAGTDGSELTVAIKESEETFDRKTAVKFLDRKVPLFENTASISTKATFRYHIRLDGNWELRPAWDNEHSLIVVAPPIQPTLPVAFDTEAMTTAVKGWWVSRMQQGDNLDRLKVGLTKKLEERSGSPEQIDSVRDVCRESVGMFVQNWLADKNQWQAEGFTEIKVLFPDESQKDAEDLPPTIRLETVQLQETVE